MVQLVSVPARLNWTIWHGQSETMRLHWPPDALDNTGPWLLRIAAAGHDPIAVLGVVEGDTLSFTLPEGATEPLLHAAATLAVSDNGRDIIAGTAIVTDHPGPSIAEATVVIEDQTVTVQLVGGLAEAPVSSVNGQTGDVVLTADDVGAAPAVSVVAHGAVGDGETDDTAAIQAAIDQAPAGSTVVFPPGTYLISAPLVLRGNMAYVGVGHALGVGATIRQADGANITGSNGVSGLLVADAWADNAGFNGAPLQVDNLHLDGNRANNPDSDACGVVLCNFWSWLDGLHITGMPLDGIHLTDVTDDGNVIANSASENRIYRSRIDGTGRDGIHQVSANTISNQDGYCVDNLISATDGSGIRFQRGSGWVFRRNHLYDLDGHGILLENCFATVISENQIEVFGSAGGAGEFWAGISVTQLDGRGTQLADNFVGSAEPDPDVGAYQYYSLTAGFAQDDAHVVLVGNLAHGPAEPTDRGIGLVLFGDVAGSVLHATLAANSITGIATERFITAEGVELVEPATDAALTAHEADPDAHRLGGLAEVTDDTLTINGDLVLNGSLVLPQTGTDISYWHQAKDFPLQTIDVDTSNGGAYVSNAAAKAAINYILFPAGGNTQIRWTWLPWAFGEVGWETFRANFGLFRADLTGGAVTTRWRYYERTVHFNASVVEAVPLVREFEVVAPAPLLTWSYIEIIGERPVEHDGGGNAGFIYSILERDFDTETANTADIGVMRVTATRQS